ncbi:MAG TPA: NYN domain-containing protein, partial [Candidatus Saccharimonadales bacterium]|nr:NYN domain-containing protein [Candidatus Saccharimonadales bacterium]
MTGTQRLLIDGTNLLHAIHRGPFPAPAATLIGRLRGVIEPAVRIELVFDGPQDRGLADSRIASGLTVRYSGRISADALIGRMVGEAVQPDTLLVVTDDAELSAEVRRRGGRTARTVWLTGRLDRSRLAAPSIGRAKPPPPSESSAANADAPEPPGWQPGRGATTKKGNGRRRPRADRGREVQH